MSQSSGSSRFDRHERERNLHNHHRGTSGSALHLAAARGHAPLVEALLAVGLKPNAVDIFAYGFPSNKAATTPVAWARVRGHVEVVRLLEGARRAQGPPLLKLPSASNGPVRIPSAVKVGTLKKLIHRGDNSFGFIAPDEGGGEQVFDHLETLRGAARAVGKQGFPAPGMRLAYVATPRPKGMRASRVADGEDGGPIELPLQDYEVDMQWGEYRDDIDDDYY